MAKAAVAAAAVADAAADRNQLTLYSRFQTLLILFVFYSLNTACAQDYIQTGRYGSWSGSGKPLPDMQILRK